LSGYLLSPPRSWALISGFSTLPTLERGRSGQTSTCLGAFSDKHDLLTHCVRQYEAACVTRYDEIVASATSAAELDLFEESFRANVLEIDQRREEMVWRVISRYAEFAGITVAFSPGVAYAMLDGMFQQALLHQLAGNRDAAGDLTANVIDVLHTLEARG
jgi:hypothetical protein